MPLSKREVQDSWYWYFDHKGNYTVKSGYKCLTENTEHHDAGNNSKFWKFIWALQVPPKVKAMLWRAARNILPTCDNLLKKRVNVARTCQVCNSDDESVFHTFVECSVAKGCWQLSTAGFVRGSNNDFLLWLKEMFERCGSAAAQEVAMIIWGLWANRNAIVWRNQASTLGRILSKAKDLLTQWSNVQENGGQVIRRTTTGEAIKWLKPREGQLKCNVDVAIFKGSNEMGTGMVIRDWNGTFVAARLLQRTHVEANVMLAEAISLREALSWIKELALENVVVELDAAGVVQLLSNSCCDYSVIGLIIEDCNYMLREIGNCNISLVRRSANFVTHLLARASNSLPGPQDWGISPPTIIVEALSNDMK